MVTVTLHGAGGFATAAIWVGMFFTLPVVAFLVGRSVGRDEGRWERDDEDGAL